MIEPILITLGMANFVDLLFSKFQVWEKLFEWSFKGKSKFLYDLFSCRLCTIFHLSWIVTVIYGLVAGFFWALLLVPYIICGITTIIKK